MNIVASLTVRVVLQFMSRLLSCCTGNIFAGIYRPITRVFRVLPCLRHRGMEMAATPVGIEHAEQAVAGYRMVDSVPSSLRKNIDKDPLCHRPSLLPDPNDYRHPFMAGGSVMHQHFGIRVVFITFP
jgi:hypothetical protein